MSNITAKIMNVYERGLGIAQSSLADIKARVATTLLLGALTLSACTAPQQGAGDFDRNNDGQLNPVTVQSVSPKIGFDVPSRPPVTPPSQGIDGYGHALRSGFNQVTLDRLLSQAPNPVFLCNQIDGTPTLYTNVGYINPQIPLVEPFLIAMNASAIGKAELGFQNWNNGPQLLAVDGSSCKLVRGIAPHRN